MEKWCRAMAVWNLFCSVFSGIGMLRTMPQLVHNLTTMSLRDTIYVLIHDPCMGRDRPVFGCSCLFSASFRKCKCGFDPFTRERNTKLTTSLISANSLIPSLYCHSQEAPHFLALVSSHYGLVLRLACVRDHVSPRYLFHRDKLFCSYQHVLLLLSHGHQNAPQVVEPHDYHNVSNFANGCRNCRDAHWILLLQYG